MIGRVSGQIAHKAADHVLIDVRGVGYIVHVSDRTLAALPAAGQFASLFTDLLVREDLLQLFGFLSLEEKEWHRLLMSVQGIGAKASMAILGTLGPDGISRAIALGDWNAVKAAPGVGPKIAQRVVNELKDKAPALMAMVAPQPAETALVDEEPAQANTAPPAKSFQTSSGAAVGQSRSDAMSALTNLGYAPGEAAAAVAEALDDTQDADSATLIRLALRKLAPKGQG